jgi:hypothetical protein
MICGWSELRGGRKGESGCVQMRKDTGGWHGQQGKKRVPLGPKITMHEGVAHAWRSS